MLSKTMLDHPTYCVLFSVPMSRIIASLLIVFVTAMHIAWASDFHFTGMDNISGAACVAGDDCDKGETHQAAADPDHCSHGSAHLVGMISGSPRHLFPQPAVTPVTATIYFSVVSSPPTTPPKA